MRVLVTGGAGFIGRPTVRLLQESGHEAAVFDLKPPQALETDGLTNSRVKTEYYQGDVANPADLQAAFNDFQPEAVVHLAALINARESFSKTVEYEKTNVQGTQEVVRACLKTGVKRLVFASSCAVYGEPLVLPVNESAELNPESPYGKQKVLGEKAVEASRENGLQTVILRYSNAYGPGPAAGGEYGVTAAFCDCIRQEKPVRIFGDGFQSRDFVFVQDVARANLAALDGACGTFNIGSGEPTTVLGLLEELRKTSGKPGHAVFEPAPAAEVRTIFLDVENARAGLKWSASTSLADGLRQTLVAQAETTGRF